MGTLRHQFSPRFTAEVNISLCNLLFGFLVLSANVLVG